MAHERNQSLDATFVVLIVYVLSSSQRAERMEARTPEEIALVLLAVVAAIVAFGLSWVMNLVGIDITLILQHLSQ